MTKVPNKESFEQKLEVLDQLHELAGIPPFSSCYAPSKDTGKDRAEYILSRKDKSILIRSWDESHHNGDSYNVGDVTLSAEAALAVLDGLVAGARATAIDTRVRWIKGEEERAVKARAQAEIDEELAGSQAAKAEAAMRKLEHHKLVLEVPGGAKIEELLNLSISYEVSVDEDGDEFYIYDVDLFGERVSSSATKPAVAMRLLSEHIAVVLRGLADDIASAAEES